MSGIPSWRMNISFDFGSSMTFVICIKNCGVQIITSYPNYLEHHRSLIEHRARLSKNMEEIQVLSIYSQL